ncbi:glycosyltransferase 87 family protein [Catellatospora citrea]|uniref:glycosyltransferase 87 family protein n=1 Tax=Catellatospora citrea TaxID=53366 RepID=UPI0033C26BD2
MLKDWRVNALWLVFATVAVVSGALALRRPEFDRLADLHVYVGAVRQAQSGRPLYEYAADNGDPFTYPPFAALVLWPLGWMSESVTRVLWLVAVVAAVAVIAVALAACWEHAPRRQLFAGVLACVLIASAPVQSDLRFGQISIFVVVLTLLDALEITPARWRGVLVGLAAAIKLTPLLFVVFFLLAGRRRDALRAAAAFAGSAVVAAVLLPADSLQFWTASLFSTARVGDMASLGNQSLHAVLGRAGIGAEHRPVVWLILVVGICALALWRARGLAREGRRAHAAVLVGCATIAASPVSWTHHQVWTVLAGMLLVASAGSARRAAGAFLLVVMTLSLANLTIESATTPGLQFVFSNIRGISVAVICCVGLGGALNARKAARDNAVALGARSVWARGLTSAVAGIAVFALLPLPPSVDPGLRLNDFDQTRQVFSQMHVCWGDGAGECSRDGSQGGRMLLNYSVGSDGQRSSVEGWVSPRVARLSMRTAPGAPLHAVPIWDLGDGERVFSFTGTNLHYAQFLAYDADDRLIENPPRDLWK